MTHEIKIQQFDFTSVHYAAARELRDQILRQPLGLRLNSKDTAGEDQQFHFGAFAFERLVGCLTLAPATPREMKMRQVAVSLDYKRKGIGRKLVEYAEKYAKDHRFEKIILHARLSAVSFYLSLGYSEFGDEFIEVGIPHKKMQKHI